MKKMVAVAALVLMAMPSLTMAGWDVRGEMNGWGQTAMTDNFDGTFTASFSGLSASTVMKYKVDENPPGDWSNAFPSQDWFTKTDGAGDLSITFDTNVIGDGWSPASNRVYSPDTGLDWEVLGDFTGWDGAPVAAVAQGGGLYSVDITIASAGAHQYKFRAPGDWGRQVGDFTGSSNIEFSSANPNETYRFELDIPNGRWRQSLIPEPATLALLGLGAVAVVRRRR